MKIEIKNFKYSEWNSEETTCFQGDLFLNGKKVGICSNDGHGGCTNYHGIEHYYSDTIKQMEEYCKTLPPIVYEGSGIGGKDLVINMTLEHYIDDLVSDILEKKNDKKKQKDMLKGLVYSKSKWSYTTISWKGHTIETLLRHPSGVEVLQKKVKELQDQGYTIENTNLPFLN